MMAALQRVYPVQKAYQMLTFPRSSYYYISRLNEKNQRLQEAIQCVAGEKPT